MVCTSPVEAAGTAGEVVVVEAIGEEANWAASAVLGVAFGPAVLILARLGRHFEFYDAAEEVEDRKLVVGVVR